MKDRQRFNEQFIADLVSVWEKHGRSAMEIAAAKDPTNFVRIATALIPKELAVAVTNQPSSLQGLTIAELTILNGVIGAIKDRVPAAGDMKPEIVFNFVSRALDAYREPKLIPPA